MRRYRSSGGDAQRWHERAGKIKLNDIAGVPISEVDRVLAAG